MSESFIKFDAFWYVKSGTLVRSTNISEENDASFFRAEACFINKYNI